jgi:hypothetical protein
LADLRAGLAEPARFRLGSAVFAFAAFRVDDGFAREDLARAGLANFSNAFTTVS